jgi:prepilin-type N-terminal cleavage/methylation domain-containing protein
MKMKPRPNKQAGFTLIEVMVTVVLMTLGLLVILGVFLGAAKANSYAKKMDTAQYLAQETLEQFRNTRFTQIHSFEEHYGQIPNCPSHRRRVTVTMNGTLKIVQVTVLFDADRHQADFQSSYANL